MRFSHSPLIARVCRAKKQTDVSLKIKKGKITLIAGPSGSGKTTLLRHLKKELLPKGKRSGKVLYDGQEIEQLKDLQSVKEVGYLFQNPSAQMVMDTVWHEIAFGLENLRMPYEQMKRTVAEIVNYFDLQKIYHEDTDKLSGGQKQRLSIARAIAINPEILVFDDSFSALDFKTDAILRAELKKETTDAIVLIVAQRIGSIMDADKIIVLDEGNVVGIGKHKELLKTCSVYKEIALSQLTEEELA